MPLGASENSYSKPTTQKGPVMRPTTFTTCDDNIPRTVLFMDARELERALLEHYRGVWEELDAVGECPTIWLEIKQELERRDQLRDRHVVHLQEHELFAEIAA